MTTAKSLLVRMAAASALFLFCLASSSFAQAGQAGKQTGSLGRLDEQVQAKGVGHLIGTISQDGRTFTQQKSHAQWIITDPALVRAYKGKRVWLKAHIDSPQHAISVVEVRPAGKPINPQPSQQ